MQESVENILIHSLLRLCETKPLKKITLNELLKVSDVSRTAFNNRYLDLNDLIYQIWLQRIHLRRQLPYFLTTVHNYKNPLLFILYLKCRFYKNCAGGMIPDSAAFFVCRKI